MALDGRQKTTVYLGTGQYRRLKFIARERGVAPAELIREAVDLFVARRGRRPLPRSLGAGRSAAGDLSERAEELLRGFGAEPSPAAPREEAPRAAKPKRPRAAPRTRESRRS